MKIGLVTPSWPGTAAANGIATSVRFLHDGFRARGHDVTIIPLDGAPSADPCVVSLPAPRRHTLGERIGSRLALSEPHVQIQADRIAAAAREAVSRPGVDVLIMEETQGWAATVQETVGVPVIVTLHGPWFLHKTLQSTPRTARDKRRERREAVGLRACAGVTAPSADVLRRTRAVVPIEGAPSAVIPNPIAVSPVLAPPFPEDGGPVPLLFVGRFDRHKGGDVLLRAFADLVESGADVRLTFVGPDRGVADGRGETVGLVDFLSAFPATVSRRIDVKGRLTKPEIDALRGAHEGGEQGSDPCRPNAPENH